MASGNEGLIDSWTLQVHYETEMKFDHPVTTMPEMPGPLMYQTPPWAVTADPSKDQTNKPTPTPGSHATSTPAPQSVQGTWNILMAETFEGVFPSAGWTVTDLSNDGYERFWDDDNYRALDGAWGAWPARGGANRLTPLFGDNYANNMDTRMAFGPIDLYDAIDATVNFWLWRQTEAGYDKLCLEVSFDGLIFYEVQNGCWDGDAPYWEYESISLQNYVGQTVWMAWRFHSDNTVTAAGPWIDDLTVQKRIAEPVTIHGRWTYNDRRSTTRPVRYATVNLYGYNNDGGFRTYLGATTTDSDGQWSIGPILNKDPTGRGALDVYAELVLDGPHAKVRLSSPMYDAYSFDGFLHSEISDGEFSLVPDDVASSLNPYDIEANWIFNDINTSWLYVTQHTTTDPGGVVVSFPDDSNYCCGITPELYVKITSNGARSPDVVVHEAGHRYMIGALKFPFTLTDPASWCLSPHGLFSEEPDGRTCAWTEGWADFFAVAVNGDPCYDFELTGTEQPCQPQGGDVYNFEAPVIPGGFPSGDGVEGRIAGALWDMLDPVTTRPDANVDRYHGSFNQIWAVYMQNAYWNFRDYWNGWRSMGYNTHDVVIVIFNHEIDYDTKPSFTSQLPDAALSSLGNGEYVVNLEGYVSDVESTPAQLIYALWQVSNPNCIATVDGAHSLHVQTAVGWVGACNITVSASDEIYLVLSSFIMRGVPPRAWLPLIITSATGGNQPTQVQTNPYPLPGQSATTTSPLVAPTPTPTPKTKPYPVH